LKRIEDGFESIGKNGVEVSNNEIDSMEEKWKENEPFGTTSAKICRICLEMEEEGNALITPCHCSGTMKYIHLNCLRIWLDNKKIKRETHWVNSYAWKDLECELCKQSLPCKESQYLSFR
jgi:E3 ubiquitin-protein ligase DOA10